MWVPVTKSSQMSKIKNIMGLRGCFAVKVLGLLEEYLSSVPNIQIRWFTTDGNSHSRGPSTPFWPLPGPQVALVHTHQLKKKSVC